MNTRRSPASLRPERSIEAPEAIERNRRDDWEPCLKVWDYLSGETP